MTAQPAHDTPQSLWREQATRWLDFTETDLTIGAADLAENDPAGEDPDPDDDPDHDPGHDPDHDPGPSPAAPAMRAWPRVFPPL